MRFASNSHVARLGLSLTGQTDAYDDDDDDDDDDNDDDDDDDDVFFFWDLRHCRLKTVNVAECEKSRFWGRCPGFSRGSHTPNRLLGRWDGARGFPADPTPQTAVCPPTSLGALSLFNVAKRSHPQRMTFSLVSRASLKRCTGRSQQIQCALGTGQAPERGSEARLNEAGRLFHRPQDQGHRHTPRQARSKTAAAQQHQRIVEISLGSGSTFSDMLRNRSVSAAPADLDDDDDDDDDDMMTMMMMIMMMIMMTMIMMTIMMMMTICFFLCVRRCR